jgi:phage baseplate assembly protein W
MTTFIGFSTIGRNKKFTLVDFELIKQDLLNAFNIRQGQLPGRPEYGTRLWDFVFENLNQATEQGILEEVQRVAGGDPRIYLQSVNVYPQDNGLLLELTIQVIPTNNAEILSIFFDQIQRNATYI